MQGAGFIGIRFACQAATWHGSPLHGLAPMWPAQAAVRLPPQQQPNQAETAQQTQQYQTVAGRPAVATALAAPEQAAAHLCSHPSTGRSGNLSRQHSGENTSRRCAQFDRSTPGGTCPVLTLVMSFSPGAHWEALHALTCAGSLNFMASLPRIPMKCDRARRCCSASLRMHC